MTSQPSTSCVSSQIRLPGTDHQDRHQLWRNNQGKHTQETGELSSVVLFFLDFSSFFCQSRRRRSLVRPSCLSGSETAKRVVHAEENSRPCLGPPRPQLPLSAGRRPAISAQPGRCGPWPNHGDTPAHKKRWLLGVADDFVYEPPANCEAQRRSSQRPANLSNLITALILPPCSSASTPLSGGGGSRGDGLCPWSPPAESRAGVRRFRRRRPLVEGNLVNRVF